MSLGPAQLAVAGWKNTLDNHRRAHNTNTPAYHNALRRLELHRSRGLDLEKTKDCVIAAARARRFVSYQEIADISGMTMAKAHLVMTSHLGALCDYAHSTGLPLLSAIVVNVEGVETGTMKPNSQAGFIKAAKLLGRDVVDESAFVKEEQERVFERFAQGATS